MVYYSPVAFIWCFYLTFHISDQEEQGTKEGTFGCLPDRRRGREAMMERGVESDCERVMREGGMEGDGVE